MRQTRKLRKLPMKSFCDALLSLHWNEAAFLHRLI